MDTTTAVSMCVFVTPLRMKTEGKNKVIISQSAKENKGPYHKISQEFHTTICLVGHLLWNGV